MIKDKVDISQDIAKIKEALAAATPGPCSEENCNKPPAKRGLCHGHYKRLIRYGSATKPTVTCKECASQFIVRRIGNTFCSRKCKERWTNRQPKAKAAQKKREMVFRGTEKGKELMKKTARAMYLKYPEKAKARSVVSHAIRKGTLIRPEKCEFCSANGRVEAHHHKGYEKENWLEVVWLCKKCHTKEDNRREVS